MAKSPEAFEECAACAAAGTDPNTIKGITMIDEKDLANYQDKVDRPTQWRHAVDIAGLVGEYDYDDTVQLCSYDEHEHYHGFLIYARCRKLLMLGANCAANYVIGFDSLLARIGLIRAVRQALEEQDRPEILLEELDEICARITPRAQAIGGIRRHLPEVDQKLRAVRNGDSAYAYIPEEELDPRTGTYVTRDKQYEVKHLEFFNLEAPRALADRVRRRLEDFRDAWDGEEIDESNARRFLRGIQALNEPLHDLHDAMDASASFWGSENLKAALYVTFGDKDRWPTGLRVESQSFVLEGPPRIVIRIDGVEVGKA